MEIKLVGSYPVQGVRELQVDYDFLLSDVSDVKLEVERREGSELVLEFAEGEGRLVYDQPSHFFRGFSLFLERLAGGEGEFSLREWPQFETVGPMFDLSRNAVLRLDKFKEFIRILAMMGFNSAMLYMEDTYEVEGEPYFGYMRGRYSYEELKELDDYADQFGIELIPCIQTLAHLEEFLKWPAAAPYKDTRGALLMRSEATYDLLERMIKSASRPFRSKRIHIGMDEAEELGRGIFLNKHGYMDRFELMSEHLKRVTEITESLGLEAMMWSDMFLKLADQGDLYSSSTEIPEHIYEATPDSVQLMYWRYNQVEYEHYEQIINQHKGFKRTPAFAGGVWVWNTFATHYGVSLPASEAALTACKQHGVKDVFVTLWGDDGFENNYYSALLGLQYYAEHAYAEELDEEKLKQRVEFVTGVPAENYLSLAKLDTPPGVAEDNVVQTNPSKFLLWQDPLLGLFDKHVEGLDLDSYYSELAETYASGRDGSRRFDYIFDVPEKLAKLLALKGTVGLKLKEAYDGEDWEALAELAEEVLPEIARRVEVLREAHREQWLSMHKPFGWEVIDIRYGGLLSRLDTAIKRVKDYLSGEVEFLDELEQERLYFTPGVEESGHLGWNSYYFRIASPNVFFHVLPIY